MACENEKEKYRYVRNLPQQSSLDDDGGDDGDDHKCQGIPYQMVALQNNWLEYDHRILEERL